MRRVVALAVCSAVVAGAGVAGTGAEASPSVIYTVAGTGVRGFSGDDGLASAARLFGRGPTGPNSVRVAAMADGGFLIADPGNNRVRRVFPDGVIRTVAGTGVSGYSGDGGPATQGRLAWPTDVAVMPDGGFLIADSRNAAVRRVDPTGVIGTVAGGVSWVNPPGYGDGGLATAGYVDTKALAADPSGGFVVAGGMRVRRVRSDGIISTIAGISMGDWSAFGVGDRGPGTGAQVAPEGMAALPDGSVLIADNARVRKVGADGIITSVAGTTPGFSGDGGPALKAKMRYLSDVEPHPDGGFLIADWFNGRVRQVDGTGTIDTVAGNGTDLTWPPYAVSMPSSPFPKNARGSGDGGPATAARLAEPGSVSVFPDGGLLIADRNTVRLVPTRATRYLGVALPPNRARAGATRYAARLVVSRPATLKVTITRDGRFAARTTTVARRAGALTAEILRRRFAPGTYDVTIHARTPDGFGGGTQGRVVLGGILTRALLVDWLRSHKLPRPGRSTVWYEDVVYRVPVCRRLTARRTDCRIARLAEGVLPRPCAVLSLQLGRDGQIHPRSYGCGDPLFTSRPRWRSWNDTLELFPRTARTLLTP